MAQDDDDVIAIKPLLPKNEDNLGCWTWFCCCFLNATVDIDIAPRLPSLDDPQLSFGVFPFDEQGNLLEGPDVHHCYKNVRNSDVKYLDVYVPNDGGDVVAGDIRKLKVIFNYNFYNKFRTLVESNKSNSNTERSPKAADLTEHRFGKGFEQGIRGMKKGGIRRFIVPISKKERKNKRLILYKVGDHAVFDVHLLEFGESLAGCIRGRRLKRILFLVVELHGVFLGWVALEV